MGDTKGMNNVTVQSNVCPMECLTAGMAKHKWVDTATLRVNPWEQKGENTQGNIGTIRKDTLQWQHERRYKRVCPNKGAGGVDDVTIEKLVDYIREHWSCIKEQIRYREYKPQPVKRGELPKPNEDVRKLGIPTVMDRVCVNRCFRIVVMASDRTEVVKWLSGNYLSIWMRVMSLVHDIINDGDTEFLIRKYLRAGVMTSQGYEETRLGTLQGGNLSLLLSNIMLNELDKELEARGLHFTRYLKWIERKVIRSVCLRYEILSTLASVMGRTEKESMFVSMESHGRKLRISCE